MAVSFDSIVVGELYTRPELADMWDYKGYQAISRGLVTPSCDNKLILFITREKRSTDTAYENLLVGDTLTMDGPADHFAEDRVLSASITGEEVHLFYRNLHRDSFCYYGQIDLISSELRSLKPSRFSFRLRSIK